MNNSFLKNLDDYKVLTPDGFKSFEGISLMNISKIYKIVLENDLFLECTYDHKIFVNGDEKKPVSSLKIGDEIFTLSGFKKIISIIDTGIVSPVYDLVEVSDGHRYYTNNILSSNCKFITFEETLINPIKLSAIKGIEPINKTGLVRWYSNIIPEYTYVVALDPSMGTGGDNAAIQVLELPTLKQVAEWSSNRNPIEDQVRTMRAMLEEIYQKGQPEIYWSVESNTLGEAALVVIRDTGEENFRGTMLHDPKNRLQGKNSRRAGFITTNKSKLEACAKMKFLIESGKMKLNSKGIISELKTFVSRANTFEARIGQTDDLVMSMILAIRMTDFISTWDDKSQEAINSNVMSEEESQHDAPMPIFI